MRGPARLIEIAGIILLLIVLAVVGSRVAAESGAPDRSGSSDIAALVSRLRLAGLTVTVRGKAHDPRLSVSGRNLTINGEPVAVYAYPDAWSADADADRLLDDSVSGPPDWVDAPHIFRDDRLLVVHEGGSSELNELLGKLLDRGANLRDVR